MIHMNHLQVVADRFPTIKNHITRKDQQNCKEVQEINFLGVQDCLKEIIVGDAAHPQISQLVEHYVILS